MSLSGLQFFWEHLTTRIRKPYEVDLSGRVCLITGGNQGLGYETALHFARMNASRIILACRKVKNGEEAAVRIHKTVPSFKGKIESWQLDHASFANVRDFARKVTSECDRLDIAVLNAGINISQWKVTGDGWEETLQVNYLSTGLLGLLLLPKLSETADLPAVVSNLPKGKVSLEKPHLAVLSSGVHYWAEFVQQDAPALLEALNDEKFHNSIDTYQISKLLDIFFTREAAALPIASKVVVNSVDPGLCNTTVRTTNTTIPGFVAWILDAISWKAEFGSRNTVVASVTTTTPAAFISNGVERPVFRFITSGKGPAIQKKLWAESVEVWKTVAPEVAGSL